MHNMVEDDDERIVRLAINKSPIKQPSDNSKKNLTQEMVENPSQKLTNATMITDHLFIGDFNLAYDVNFLKTN